MQYFENNFWLVVTKFSSTCWAELNETNLGIIITLYMEKRLFLGESNNEEPSMMSIIKPTFKSKNSKLEVN